MLPGLVGAIAGARPQRTMKETLTLLGLTTNLKLCLDAGDLASVASGSQTKWLYVSGGGYDFFRGTDGTSQASPSPKNTRRPASRPHWYPTHKRQAGRLFSVPECRCEADRAADVVFQNQV